MPKGATTASTSRSLAARRGAAPAAGGPAAVVLPAAISVMSAGLPVSPGQLVAARVLAASGGAVELSIAGGHVSAESSLPLVPGESLRLVVVEATPGRIVLREAPGATPAAAQPTALTDAGLPATAARALLAAAAELGLSPRSPAEAGALGARAASAGVKTPAQAASFARLAARGLPTSPGSVAGLAALLEGVPIGRALATVLSLARQAISGAGATGAPPSPSSTAPHAASLARLVDMLHAVVTTVARRAVEGQPEALRRALADLGTASGARGAGARSPESSSVRSLLLQIAVHPTAEAMLARAAATAADAVGAQALAAAAPTASFGADGGSYFQLPLPGGDTAEIRVAPDAEHRETAERGGKGQRLAFLLHLSALGPVVIDAAVARDGVNAVVRVARPEAQRLAAARIGGLERGLRGIGVGRPTVSVEPLRRDGTTGLIPPPPASGLDLSA